MTKAGGCPSGRDSEDREGERLVFRRHSISPSLPSETSHPPPLIQAQVLRTEDVRNVDRGMGIPTIHVY